MSSLDNEGFRQIDFSLKTKELRISERDRNDSQLFPVNNTNMKLDSMIYQLMVVDGKVLI